MKKCTLLFLLMAAVYILSACGRQGELDYVKDISPDQIFNQKEDRYYIYFHRLDCPDCESSDPNVIQYAYILQNSKTCSGKRPVYGVLLYTEAEQPGKQVYIYRQYEGAGGQGTDGKYFVIGVKNWKDLYIASTASLIAVSTNANGEKEASYVAQGSANVNEALQTHLEECYS
jgi:predicted small lipoprotein YifL